MKLRFPDLIDDEEVEDVNDAEEVLEAVVTEEPRAWWLANAYARDCERAGLIQRTPTFAQELDAGLGVNLKEVDGEAGTPGESSSDAGEGSGEGTGDGSFAAFCSEFDAAFNAEFGSDLGGGGQSSPAGSGEGSGSGGPGGSGGAGGGSGAGGSGGSGGAGGGGS